MVSSMAALLRPGRMERVSPHAAGADGWTIRPWEPTDREGVRALHDRTPPAGSLARNLLQRWPDDLDRILEVFQAFWVVTTERDGSPEIIGMAGVKAVDDEVPLDLFPGEGDRKRMIRLLRMRIAPEWQRRGIGSRLVETVVTWAGNSGYRSVILETTIEQEPAVALYRRHGFAAVGCSRLERYTLVWMRRDLD